MKKFAYTTILFLLLSTVSCKTDKNKEEDSKVTTEMETKNEWITLFDGKTTKGWRAYNGQELPPGWIAKDGELQFDTELGKEQDYTGGTDIIYGAEEFDNSGIFYHLKEGYDSPPEVSPEYQLIDDENYASMHDLTSYNLSLGYTDKPEELKPLQQTASDYAMHAADPNGKILNPAGEWNTTKIIFTPEQVEHWLNGKKVVSFVPWDEAWYEKKNSDKWKNSKDYGKFKTGYIGFQDHSSPIWFRNIKIKKL